MIEGRKILGSIGLGILTIFVIVAVFAPYIAPHDPHQMYRPMEHPSSRHLLGTNDIGNDILSEIVYGTRVSLFIAFIVSVISMLIGTSLGLVAGYFDKDHRHRIIHASEHLESDSFIPDIRMDDDSKNHQIGGADAQDPILYRCNEDDWRQ
jgi:ABC-type dipeptide/oligopeptide/nickel transport system permease subunit